MEQYRKDFENIDSWKMRSRLVVENQSDKNVITCFLETLDVHEHEYMPDEWIYVNEGISSSCISDIITEYNGRYEPFFSEMFEYATANGIKLWYILENQQHEEREVWSNAEIKDEKIELIDEMMATIMTLRDGIRHKNDPKKDISHIIEKYNKIKGIETV